MARPIPIVIFLFFCGICLSQNEEIFLNNPSFEDMPHQGGGPFDIGIRGWYDCGAIQFPDETPPDIHPIDFWLVTHPPQDGNTYLGMVIRDNDSWESVSQRLSRPLKAGMCYEISAYMARSLRYLSGSKELMQKENKAVLVNYTEPAVLRIWGGTGVCGRQELLVESNPIRTRNWQQYAFKLEPNRDYNYITFEGFYEVPVLFPYNGHILLDNVSSIVEIPCDESIAIEIPVEEEVQPSGPAIPADKAPREAKSSNNDIAFPTLRQTITAPLHAPPSNPQAVSGLGYNKIKKGQVIRIENLYFEMDKSVILEESHKELDLIHKFLDKHNGVVVEIGGHTNTVPKQDYCLVLSENRARAIADYLIEKGIAEHRIKYKGYGKSRPIIYDDKFDMKARRKNQRVEIKILELG